MTEGVRMWEDDMETSARRKVVWLAGGVAVVLAAAGAWYWYSGHEAAALPAPAAAVLPAAPVSSEPQISHPIPADNDAAALPSLNDSDQVVHDSLAGVIGHDPVEQFLVPQNIVRHLVVTVDNLPRKKLAVDLRPLKPTAGQTATATQGDIVTLSPENFERYTPLMRVLEKTDVKALAVVYERLYPLFQQSYEDLGYPGKYFNDRLVEVIDHLLQTPEVTTPIQLAQPKVFYEYADQDLEGRSAGQKLLIRMGAANERIIKAKLRDFRTEIVKKK
jgi:hypothetical protein